MNNEGLASDDACRELLLKEDEVANAVAESGTGEYDGHELGSGSCRLYFYGPSADLLFRVVMRALQGSRVDGRLQITRRYGGPGAPEKTDDVEILSDD